jgi:protein-S-isoprenylcysteine O-methyltransferase Ste14
MDADLQARLSIAALACSVLALIFSLLAAFPGLKDLLAAIRDGVLWLALLLVLAGAGFVVWQHIQQPPAATQQAASASH